MDVRKDDFPVVLQAYEIFDNKEVFVAEQVVNNQNEVDTFTKRFAGKLIKAKQHSITDSSHRTTIKKRNSSAGTIILIIVIILIALVALGFATGWIQEHFNIHF